MSKYLINNNVSANQYKRYIQFALIFVFASFLIISCDRVFSSFEIEKSEREITDSIKSIFKVPNTQNYYRDTPFFKDYEYYKSIVFLDTNKDGISFKHAIDSEDSLFFVNKYGDFHKKYMASHNKSSWESTIYSLIEGNCIKSFKVTPFIIGFDDKEDSIFLVQTLKNSCGSLDYHRLQFDDIDEVRERIEIEEKLLSLDKIKTKYHHIEKENLRRDKYVEEKCIKSSHGVLTYKVTPMDSFYIAEDGFSPFLKYLLWVFLGLLLSYIVHQVKHYLNRSNSINVISSTEIDKTIDIEYEDLLQKLDPENFSDESNMKKRRIAESLYRILLKARYDNNIIEMVYKKAQKDLNIK